MGVPGLRALPQLASSPSIWTQLQSQLEGRRFLHSEGLSTILGPPLSLGGPLLERCREMVARFDGFYRSVIDDYYASPARRADLPIEPSFARAIEADQATRTALPLARLDCVLTSDGQLRVIEINPIGVCTLHLRSAAYLAWRLRRAGLDEDAARVDTLYDALPAAFARYGAAERGAPLPPSPTVGVLTLPNAHRGTRVTWRAAFARAGWRYVDGTVDDLEVSPSGMKLRGQPLDLLWGDYLFHLGYQAARYKHTRFASKAGDFSAAPAMTARVLEDPIALELFRSRRVLNISPAQAYLAISKHLLSYVHRSDGPVPSAALPYLQEHVARTYSAVDRREGVLTVADATRDRERLLLKPCRYGGAHGVQAGRELSPAAWAERLEETWQDPEWVLQELYLPHRTPDDQWLSVGLYSYGGVLGGVTLRTAPTLVVSARKSAFIPVVLDG